MKNKKLFKSNKDKKICGVCGGIAEYFEIDSTLVRLGCILLCCCSVGILAYFVAAIIMPSDQNISK